MRPHFLRKTQNFDDLLSVKKAAKLLGVSQTTIRNWDRAGKLNAIRHPINNSRLYDPDQLTDLLKSTRLQILNPPKPGAKHDLAALSYGFSDDPDGFHPQIVVMEDNGRDIEILKQALG